MEELKEKLPTPVVLPLPEQEMRLITDTDTCHKQVGCLIQQ